MHSPLYLLSMCDAMAKNTHNKYLEDSLINNITVSPAVNRPWEELDETYKISNREQVRFTLERLLDSNIGMRPVTSVSNFQFKQEDLQVFAKLEHDRWSRERIDNGWTYGEIRDNAKKLHPCLVEWDLLIEEEKQKDVDVIEKIPFLLAGIGYELYYKTN